LKRYLWKTEVIKATGDNLALPPVLIPAAAAHKDLALHTESITGRRITLYGKFDHDHEVKLGPRSAPASVGSNAQGMAINPQGYYVITPFRLESGATVFINRGWVPTYLGSSWMRPSGRTEVVAVVSEFEKKATFSPDNNMPGRDALLWLEEEAVIKRSGLKEPQTPALLFEELRGEPLSSAKARGQYTFPVCKTVEDLKEQRVMPLTHLAYSATWFMLAIAGIFMTHSKFKVPTRIKNRGGPQR